MVSLVNNHVDCDFRSFFRAQIRAALSFILFLFCPGDRIVKVNGESIIGKTYSQVIALIQNR